MRYALDKALNINRYIEKISKKRGYNRHRYGNQDNVHHIRNLCHNLFLGMN